LIGLFGSTAASFREWSPVSFTEDLRIKVEALIAARAAARKAKNFAEADRIRGEIAALGVVLEDGASGTTWKVGG
jgi:cysteinyl-tRNA synthetase